MTADAMSTRRPELVGRRLGSDPARVFVRAAAAAAIVMLAARIDLPVGLTIGTVLSAMLSPLWLPVVKEYVGAKWLIVSGVLVLLAGLWLAQAASADHTIDATNAVSTATLLLGALAGIGVILWSRSLFRTSTIAALFGLGLLLGISRGSELFIANPWRFGYSVGVTIIVLALAERLGSKVLQLGLVLLFAVASAVTDARSSFAFLLLTAVIMLWQLRPVRRRAASALTVVIVLAGLAVVIYNLGQAAILDGYLGDSTRERTQAQVDTSGSLILGGRPELAGTAALMQDRPIGFGVGTMPTLSDILVAKSGMAEINYQPNNGYVENYMFGDGFELHSNFGDLWVIGGVLGLVFAATLLVLVLRGLGTLIGTSTASALMIYLAVKGVWNIFFSPLYSSVPLLVLLLGLILLRRGATTSDSRSPAEDRR